MVSLGPVRSWNRNTVPAERLSEALVSIGRRRGRDVNGSLRGGRSPTSTRRGMVDVNHPTMVKADTPFDEGQALRLQPRAHRPGHPGVQQQKVIDVVDIDAAF